MIGIGQRVDAHPVAIDEAGLARQLTGPRAVADLSRAARRPRRDLAVRTGAAVGAIGERIEADTPTRRESDLAGQRADARSVADLAWFTRGAAAAAVVTIAVQIDARRSTQALSRRARRSIRSTATALARGHQPNPKDEHNHPSQTHRRPPPTDPARLLRSRNDSHVVTGHAIPTLYGCAHLSKAETSEAGRTSYGQSAASLK